MRDADNKAVTIGDIDGSCPTKLPERKDLNYFGNLNVKDIPGTAAGTKRLGAFHSTSRRNFLSTTDTSDIAGAQPNTLKRGL